MRYLNEHQVNPANDTLTIAVVDEPGSGGANHTYFIGNVDFDGNPGSEVALNYAKAEDAEGCVVLFQNGPINEVGVNGVTHEALLAILCDRMRGFQSGPYASADNAEALACMEQAQAALLRRTRARMARGVEGTHTV
jgi:hypothetical protein